MGPETAKFVTCHVGKVPDRDRLAWALRIPGTKRARDQKLADAFRLLWTTIYDAFLAAICMFPNPMSGPADLEASSPGSRIPPMHPCLPLHKWLKTVSCLRRKPLRSVPCTCFGSARATEAVQVRFHFSTVK